MPFADAYEEPQREDMEQHPPLPGPPHVPGPPQGLGSGSYAGMMGQQTPAAPPPGGSQWRPVMRPAGQPPSLGEARTAPAAPYSPDLFQQLDPRLQMQVDELERAQDIIRGDQHTSGPQKLWALQQIDGKLRNLDPEGNYSRAAGHLRGTIPDITKAMAQRMQVMPEHGFAVALQPDGKMLFHKLEYPKAAQQQQPWDPDELAKHVVVDPRTGHSYIRQPDGKITHVPSKNDTGPDKQAEAELKRHEQERQHIFNDYNHFEKELTNTQEDEITKKKTVTRPKHEEVVDKLRQKWGDEAVARHWPSKPPAPPAQPPTPGPQFRPLGKARVLDAVRQDKGQEEHDDRLKKLGMPSRNAGMGSLPILGRSRIESLPELPAGWGPPGEQ